LDANFGCFGAAHHSLCHINKKTWNGKSIMHASCQIKLQTIIALVEELYMAKKLCPQELANNYH
jgi:hypothetical protein